MTVIKQEIQDAASYITENAGEVKPEIGLILGSGLGVLAEEIENPVKIAYSDIPNFPVSTVAGHAGQFVFGQLNGNVTAGVESENSSHIVHVGRVTSEGYQINTDYDNANYYLKSTFNKNAQAIEMTATFLERKFGAQNFYTTNQLMS